MSDAIHLEIFPRPEAQTYDLWLSVERNVEPILVAEGLNLSTAEFGRRALAETLKLLRQSEDKVYFGSNGVHLPHINYEKAQAA